MIGDRILRERFAVTVRLRVLEGKAAVGILDVQNKTFFMDVPAWPLPRAMDVIVARSF